MTGPRRALAHLVLALSLSLATGCSSSLAGGGDGGLPPEDAAGTDAGLPPDGAMSTDAGGGADAGPPLDCDAAFAFPASPTDAAPFEVQVTDGTGWAFVGMDVSGPGGPSAEWVGVAGGGPYTWTYRIRGAAAGVLSLAFTADSGAVTVARCDVRVASAGGAADAGVDADVPPTDAGTGTAPPANRFGIGLVGPGNTAQLDLTADLAGPGGFLKMIFVGVRPGMTGPTTEWTDVVREAYARDLVPVVRFAPDWGDRRVRNQSDGGSDGLAYTGLAESYVSIVRGLPLRPGWPFYVEVHNEPNLCSEWLCDRGRFDGDRIPYDRIATEYASLLRDVARALHAAFPGGQVKVVNAGLAPGGVRWCECNGTSEGAFEPGITSREFLSAMSAGVPGVFAGLDAFASHSYPAEGEGWGFFVPYDRSGTGLLYFESELTTIGRDLPVLMTETGWHGGSFAGTSVSRGEQAAWTVSAYRDVWLTHPKILAVMPFILQDGGSWDFFAWVDPGGGARQVYSDVRSLRCATIAGRCP